MQPTDVVIAVVTVLVGASLLAAVVRGDHRTDVEPWTPPAIATWPANRPPSGDPLSLFSWESLWRYLGWRFDRAWAREKVGLIVMAFAPFPMVFWSVVRFRASDVPSELAILGLGLTMWFGPGAIALLSRLANRTQGPLPWATWQPKID